MAETINFRKRLIGKEDINFDINGTGETENFFTAESGQKKLSKINASHFPLTQKTRSALNAANVDEALLKLSEKVDDFEAGDVLTEDTTVIFSKDDDIYQIQETINDQKKNLNNHTLTFIFPSSLDQGINATLLFQDFFNGTVIITGESEEPKIRIYDLGNVDALFKIYRCQCEVIIRYFNFDQKNAIYGISAESSAAVVVESCSFSGIKDTDSYAVNKSAANVILVNCEVTDDIEFFPPEKADDSGPGKYIGEIFAYSSAEPPEGAYLLNGQTIYNCQTFYPRFWNWLNKNAGDIIATPVYKQWSMPKLFADGTVGGTEYAVEMSSAPVSGYNAYKSFDTALGGAQTYAAIANSQTGYLTYYSPQKLKLSQIIFRYSTVGAINTRPVTFAISGSNDNRFWDDLVSGDFASTANNAVQAVNIEESFFDADTPGYKYYRFAFVNGGGTNVNCPEITLYAQEYKYTDYTSDGNILILSNEVYENILSRTGVCGGFVINSAIGSVRLPKWKYQAPLGETLPVRGNGISLGLTNGTDYGAIFAASTSGYPGSLFISSPSYGSAVSSGQTNTPRFNGTLGVTADPNKSGIVAENNAPTDQFFWCIQVYNTATELSEQESAQLTTQMQMKAQTDLANVDSNIDFVVESWNDDAGNWYRKYRSGWTEQGGPRTAINKDSTETITLHVEFANTEYYVRDTAIGNTTSSDVRGSCRLQTRTVTTFTLIQDTFADDGGIWYACGQAATE